MGAITNAIPVGLCQCGCGLKAPLAKWSDKRTGITKGFPVRFITGHQRNKHSTASDFWSLVDRSNLRRCWLWKQSPMKNGYGQFRMNGRFNYAHRLAWGLTHGVIPDGLYVCHVCDVPLCCNPSHLFLGTALANNRDAIAKGRANNQGAKNGQAVIEEAEVCAIRAMYSGGRFSHSEIARTWNISREHVRDICNRKRWRHIA